MSAFINLLHANSEYLLQAIYRVAAKQSFKLFGRARVFAASLSISEEQLVCGLGFNSAARNFTDIISSLGFSDFEQLKARRNEVFCSDVYERLSLENIAAIYFETKKDARALQEIQPLLLDRISTIERALEANVRPKQMQLHRLELEMLYRDGIATIEFAEARLAKPDNGFRSMLNEVQLIAGARLIPPGDIFFRDSVLPQEKRRLIDRGLVPRALIVARLKDSGITDVERQVLESSLALDETFD